MLTPDAIRQQRFTISRRGFDRAEVIEYLTSLSRRVADLEGERHGASGDDVLVRAETEAQDLLRYAMSFSKKIRAEACEAAMADRQEAADLLESARTSAAALVRGAEERARAIIESAKTDRLVMDSAQALHPSMGGSGRRPNLMIVAQPAD
jgi:DivIVA domain-containing protein